MVAVTFDPHPMAVLRPEHAPHAHRHRATAAELLAGRRCRRRASWCPFDREVAALVAAGVRRPDVLVEGLHAAGVVVGANFRFGTRAAGDVAFLRRGRRASAGFARRGGRPRRRTAGVVLDLRPHLSGRR